MTDLVEELKKQQKLYSDKKKEIEYLNIYTPDYVSSAKGSYLDFADQIKIFTSDLANYHQTDLDLTSTLVHENGHDEVAHVYHLGMGPKELYKVAQCDEISQNIRSLLYQRNEYLRTGDIKTLDSVDGRFSFYKEAVEKGEISPILSSQDKESFDKEMSLIMNGTMDMWNKKFNPYYKTQLDLLTKEYIARVGEKAQPNPKNYNKAINEMLTIGGVNFNKYRQQDFTCDSELAKDLTELIETGEKEDIAYVQKEFKKEVSTIPTEKVKWRDRRKGYVSKYDTSAREELKASSGTIVEDLGNGKSYEIDYTQTPETKEIPDLSDDEFIKQPTKESKLAERLQELRGLKSGEKSIGGGAASLLNKNRFIANDIQMQKAINDKIKYARC